MKKRLLQDSINVFDSYGLQRTFVMGMPLTFTQYTIVARALEYYYDSFISSKAQQKLFKRFGLENINIWLECCAWLETAKFKRSMR